MHLKLALFPLRTEKTKAIAASYCLTALSCASGDAGFSAYTARYTVVEAVKVVACGKFNLLYRC